MNKKWNHVVVLGAAGKMGRGIALLLLQQVAERKESVLTLLDANAAGFEELRKYLRQHLLRYAEKNINKLRKCYADRKDLTDNSEMIQIFVENAFDRVRLVTAIEECQGATMIFEAILEDLEVKTQVFFRVKEVASDDAYYFSNTSSIPIHVLQEESGLEGRLIGFHFYNPPALQKLLEIIVPEKNHQKIQEFAVDLGNRLDKTIVFSNDIAGFIGNGYFIREIVEICRFVEQLCHRMPSTEALCWINQITQEFLLRPMGGFQLIDYVGIDVVQHIARIMTHYLPDNSFNAPLIDAMVSLGIKGGQHGDGSQKEGFFSYERGKPVKVYDLNTHSYIPFVIKEEWKQLPVGHEAWKVLSQDKDQKSKLTRYFKNLFKASSQEATITVHFLEHSRMIAHALVAHGVAHSIEDVNKVLSHGFFHLYGVDDPWTSLGGEL